MLALDRENNVDFCLATHIEGRYHGVISARGVDGSRDSRLAREGGLETHTLFYSDHKRGGW